MKLLLVRHGNTFAPGDTPVRVGANEDLPLTAEGEAQALALAEQLATANLCPDVFICGPLKRTRHHTDIIMTHLAAPGSATIDARLTEIDYGPWGGLSDDQIVARFGTQAEQELRAWDEKSEMPATWAPRPAEITANLRALTNEIAAATGGGTALICSSNGILRFFLELTADGLAHHQAAGRAKMSTGAASMLEITDGTARVLFWNLKAGSALPAGF